VETGQESSCKGCWCLGRGKSSGGASAVRNVRKFFVSLAGPGRVLAAARPRARPRRHRSNWHWCVPRRICSLGSATLPVLRPRVGPPLLCRVSRKKTPARAGKTLAFALPMLLKAAAYPPAEVGRVRETDSSSFARADQGGYPLRVDAVMLGPISPQTVFSHSSRRLVAVWRRCTPFGAGPFAHSRARVSDSPSRSLRGTGQRVLAHAPLCALLQAKDPGLKPAAARGRHLDCRPFAWLGD
jgi:hypothetical protein